MNREVAILTAFIFMATGAAFPDAPDWQADGVGPMPAVACFHAAMQGVGDRYGGLCHEFTSFDLRMLKRFVPCWALPDWTSWMSGFYSDAGGAFAARFQKEHVDFGIITPVAPGDWAGSRKVESRDWAHVTMSFFSARTENEMCRMTLTRVFPGAIIESKTDVALFNRGAAAPEYAAFVGADGELDVFRLDSGTDLKGLSEALSGLALDMRWMLLWSGAEGAMKTSRFPRDPYYAGEGYTPADCPFLLVFGADGPGSARQGAKLDKEDEQIKPGLVLGKTGERLRFTIMPLYGDYFPLVKETKQWLTSMIPDNDGVTDKDKVFEKVMNDCQWWAQRLAAVPYTVRETYAYMPDKDIVEIASKFSHIILDEAFDEPAMRLAPLPPMLALAAEYGFPVEMPGTPSKTCVRTAYGPYTAIEGADSHTCRMPGLAKYAFGGRRMAGSADAAPAALLAELEREVGWVLEAGHLAPWFPMQSYKFQCIPDRMAFWHPGFVHYVLGEVLPLLDSGLQDRVREYLQREAEDYPIEGPMLSAIEGRLRHRCADKTHETVIKDMSPGDMVKKINVFTHNNMPSESGIYCLDRHAAAVGKPPDAFLSEAEEIFGFHLKYNDWPSLGWLQRPLHRNANCSLTEGYGGVPDVHQRFAAAAAAIRMARAAGSDESMYWGLLAKAAILRYAMAKYMLYIYDSGILELQTDPAWMTQPRLYANRGGSKPHLYTFNFTGPQDDMNVITHMNQFGIDVYDGVRRYSGGGLIHCWGITPEMGRFMRDYLRPDIVRYVERVEDNMPDWHMVFGQPKTGGEIHHEAPENAYYTFLARAWVAGDKPELLERYLDVPAVRGDLYYMHKLSETIKAYQGWEWE